MKEEILRMENVAYNFRECELYSGSLSVLKGEIAGIIGLRNSGISELLQILNGKCTYQQGNIYLDERRIRPRALERPWLLGIADIHYSSVLNHELTVAENIVLMNHLKNKMKLLKRQAMNEQADQLLHSLGIEISVQIKAGQLTLAQQHMVLIARAIYEGSRIVILENIHQQYSKSEMDELGWLVRRTAKRGISFICKYYNDSYMLKYMDKLIFMRNGATVGEFERSYFTDVGSVSDMLGQSEEIVNIGMSPASGREVIRVSGFCTRSNVSPVNFNICEGETVALLDEEGSRGSEITDVISGKDISSYIEGKVYMDQEWIQIAITKDIMEKRMAFIPENAARTGLYTDMTIGDNILLTKLVAAPNAFRHFGKRIPGFMAREFLAALPEGTGAKYDVYTKVKEMDEKTRYELLFYKNLKINPRLFIMKNPLAYNDEATRTLISQKIKILNQKGIAVLLDVHDRVSIPAIDCRILKLHP